MKNSPIDKDCHYKVEVRGCKCHHVLTIIALSYSKCSVGKSATHGDWTYIR